MEGLPNTYHVLIGLDVSPTKNERKQMNPVAKTRETFVPGSIIIIVMIHAAVAAAAKKKNKKNKNKNKKKKKKKKKKIL